MLHEANGVWVPSSREIVSGSVVRLNSGGPMMTVKYVWEKSQDLDCVYYCWNKSEFVSIILRAHTVSPYVFKLVA